MDELVRVLIVDDEYIIRNWISMVVEKNASRGFFVTGAVGSGSEAVEICKNEIVDIIITDIKMSAMSGLELVKIIKDDFPHIRFVLVSNYEDFSYAKKGLQLGISDYLLKAEITEQDIVSCLIGLQKEILQNRRHNELDSNSRDLYLLQQYCLEKIFSKAAVPKQQDALFKKLHLSLSEENLFIMVFSPDCLNSRLDENIQKVFYSIVREKLLLKFPSGISFFNSDGNVICIVNAVYDGLKTAEEQLYTISSVMIYEVYEKAGLSISCAISTSFNCFNQFNIQYCNALELLDTRFYTQGRQTYLKSGVVIPDKTENYTAFLKKLRYLLNQFEYKKAMEELSKISRHILAEKTVVPSHVRQLYCTICELFVSQVFTNSYSNTIREIDHMYDLVKSSPLMSDMIIDVQQFCHQICENQSGFLETENTIEKVINYMSEHYSEKITLTTASKLANMSENYFSKVFKKYAGENFNNYLVNLRINIAKNELVKTDAKIYSIAEHVGFNNVAYFTQVFKKLTGNSPEQYRSLYNGASEYSCRNIPAK